jgi:predicted nucleic acid-binding protein
LSYVLDASAGVELLLGTATGSSVQSKLPAGVGWVPEIYYAEVAGAIRRLENAGLITPSRAAAGA